jgi:FMN-dependent NADH-azoreductase
MDHRTAYLKTVLGFLGMDDVSFIHAFGVAGGDQGIRAAESEIDDIITSAAVLNAA